MKLGHQRKDHKQAGTFNKEKALVGSFSVIVLSIVKLREVLLTALVQSCA